MDRKQYSLAQLLFEEEINESKGSEKAKKAFLLGNAYSLNNKSTSALKWYLNSEKYGASNDQLYMQIARTSKEIGNYEQAISYFNKVSDKDVLLLKDAKREIDICKQVSKWAERENEFSVNLLTESNASIYLNGFNAEGQLLVTSDQAGGAFSKKDKWTGRHFSKFYVINPDKPDVLSPFENWKNKEYHQANASFNKDHTEMIFTICNKDLSDENHCKLYSSKLIKDKWSEEQLLPFTKEGVNYGHPFLSRDSILFFSSNDAKGKGAYDIFYSTRSKNKWSKPQSLPENINTTGNEKFPTVHNDTLYFSSDHHPGMGGLDIFKIYVRSNGQWSAPQNLSTPINSPADDFGLQFKMDENEEIIAYFNTSRSTPEGRDKIYSVSRNISKGDNDLVNNKKPKEAIKKNYKLYLSLKVIEKVFEIEGDPNSRVIGKKALPNSQGNIGPNGGSFTTRKDGRYIKQLAFGENYNLLVKKEGYLNNSLIIKAPPYPESNLLKENQTLTIEIELQKPYLDQEIVLQNIYYDLDKWDIREDAKPTLDKLFNVMNANPNLSIIIGSHTDCRADEEYNLGLSDKRANAVVEYLQLKGIMPSRLESKGFGKSKLIEDCECSSCSEKQHQKNRRTTFILKEQN